LVFCGYLGVGFKILSASCKILIIFKYNLGRSQDYFQGTRGDRAQIVKHHDNLTLEGSHSMEKVQDMVVRGERATIVRHEDNLKVNCQRFYYVG